MVSPPVVLQTGLGYYGIGIPENASAPGRTIITDSFERDRNARIEVKAWETSGPVCISPEALGCLNFNLAAFTPPPPTP